MKLLGLALALAFALLAAPRRIVTFARDPVGKTPPGWTVVGSAGAAAPEWEVRRDGTAAAQPYVLACVPSKAEASGRALALLNGVVMRDGDVSVRLKPVGGSHIQAGGLVFRYRDENHYYLARADVMQQNVAVFKVENGQRISVGPAAKHELPPGGWRILKISARGNRFQLYLDHRRILDVSDRAFPGPGRVGLWTEGDSVTYFDDFRVDPK